MSLAGEPLPPEFNPSDIRFAKAAARSTGPVTGGGPPQVVSSDAGFWRADYSSMFLRGLDMLKWSAFEAKVGIDPGLVFHVPRRNCLLTPRRIAGVAVESTGVPFDDGASFDDGATFAPENEDFVPAATAALRATQISVHAINGLAPRAGQSFTIWSPAGPRLYDIARVDPQGASIYILDIWPCLRRALALTDGLEFENVVCSMVVTGGTNGLVERLRRYGSADIEFTESPWY